MTRARKGRDDKSRRGKKENKLILPRQAKVKTLEYCTTGFNPESSIHNVIQHMDEIHQPIKRQSIHFEFALFVYLIAHLLVQNYNIYRVVCTQSPFQNIQIGSKIYFFERVVLIHLNV